MTVQTALPAPLVDKLDELARTFGIARSSLIRSLLSAGAGVAELGLDAAPDAPDDVLRWVLDTEPRR